ncbi:MAG TPA: ABC transporter substrate-binding protein, partial [Bacteroidales bacterium]|nr:ABC transporter substrate-binding protein [Bacteroidales bacterium]
MKRVYKPVVFFLLLFCLLSCNRLKDKDETRTVFRYNESAGISTLDPGFAKDQAHIWVCNQLYNGLVQPDDSMFIRPCVAKSWTVSADGLVYTFVLRDDVYFHDDAVFPKGTGRQVVASDFVYSFGRIANDKIASPGAWIFNDVARDSSGIPCFSAPADTVFVVKLKQPFPPFLSMLQMPYCAVVPHEAVEHYGGDFRSHAVGTGPFKLKRWIENQRLILVKNDNY